MKKIVLITCSFLIALITNAQLITTIAGGGVGDGGLAINTSIYQPASTTIDAAGNIYIADFSNNRIRKINASTGIITTVAGNGTAGYSGDGAVATSAELNNPSGVVVDISGNIYIADELNYRIRKVTASTGIITTIAGNGMEGYLGDGNLAVSAQLDHPNGLAIDALGNIYISDKWNYCIRKVSKSTGIITTVAGNGTPGYSGDGDSATSAELSEPMGVAIDNSGNIYIADAYNYRIRKVSAVTGIITTVAGNGTSGYAGDGATATLAELSEPNGVAVDTAGNIFIADTYNNRIRKVTVNTGIVITVAGNGSNNCGGDEGAATSAELFDPNGLTIDGLGNIYIADTWNNRVRKINIVTGIITTMAGNGSSVYAGDGGLATLAGLPQPSGIAVDTAGNIYIADSYNNRIRKVNASTGIITTVVGNGSAGYSGDGAAAVSAELNNPSGVAVDAAGNIYIADANNYRIRKVNVSTGIITTVAGNGLRSNIGDGGLATLAELIDIGGVAVDAAGNIYVSSGTTIRKVSASTGIINTVAGNGNYGYSGDGGTAIDAVLTIPSGIAITALGNIYIADAGSNTIRKVCVNSSSIITTVAGIGSAGFSGDNSSATSAKLAEPLGVAIDASGNIYIADARNNRIRKVTFNFLSSDIDQSGITDINDFLLLLGRFNQHCTCAEDIDRNGIVNIDDFLILVGNYNQSTLNKTN